MLGNALLPPPENLADYLERVNVFSSVFQVMGRVMCYYHPSDKNIRIIDRATSLSGKRSPLNAR